MPTKQSPNLTPLTKPVGHYLQVMPGLAWCNPNREKPANWHIYLLRCFVRIDILRQPKHDLKVALYIGCAI